ncbi:hypothetical protein E2C01_003351 [Portunus trituberculatus]|uniref:Uncharacterized protein n=1 Tax=Portunus trituberculatus TaxID=210409 RepID=A0A5B7CPJ6_PORTR|nr:hypothetical protein [Portunus trituberculatus]
MRCCRFPERPPPSPSPLRLSAYPPLHDQDLEHHRHHDYATGGPYPPPCRLLATKTRGDPGSEPAVVRRRLSSSPSAGLHASPGSNQHQGEAYKGVASITSRRPRSTLPHRPPFLQRPSPPRILQPRRARQA